MVKEEKKSEEKITTKSNSSKKEYTHAVGRRREAIARVRLYIDPKNPVLLGDKTAQKGEMWVNGQLAIEYFSGDVAKALMYEPLRVTNLLQKALITAKVIGGGKSGQLGALVHGISRALSSYDTEKLRPILKKKGFLTRDPRTRERRKVGTGGKARRKKQSPKR